MRRSISLPLSAICDGLFINGHDIEERAHLMVTPHVVGNHEEADLLTDEYLTTVKDVKKRIDAKLKNTQADLHIHNADDKTGE